MSARDKIYDYQPCDKTCDKTRDHQTRDKIYDYQPRDHQTCDKTRDHQTCDKIYDYQPCDKIYDYQPHDHQTFFSACDKIYDYQPHDHQTRDKTRDHKIVKANLKIDSDGMARAGDADEYAAAGAFKREGKVGAYVGAGVEHAEWDDGDLQANGPNVGAGVQLSLIDGTRAVVKAELVSVSASAGPVNATLGLSAETGGTIGLTQVEAKVLGTGFSLGRKVGVSFLGSGFEFKLW